MKEAISKFVLYEHAHLVASELRGSGSRSRERIGTKATHLMWKSPRLLSYCN